MNYHNLMVEILSFMYNKESSYGSKLGYDYHDIFTYLKDKHPEIEHNVLYWHLTIMLSSRRNFQLVSTYYYSSNILV